MGISLFHYFNQTAIALAVIIYLVVPVMFLVLLLWQGVRFVPGNKNYHERNSWVALIMVLALVLYAAAFLMGAAGMLAYLAAIICLVIGFLAARQKSNAKKAKNV